MQTIDNQKEYWNKVASVKTFTHPLDEKMLLNYITKKDKILDYGCGYGRIVKLLKETGFENVLGVDTSTELVNRGNTENQLTLQAINSVEEIAKLPNQFDCILVFAVLTCIPSNHGQRELINKLHSKLSDKGYLYISDYYLQDDVSEIGRYEYFNRDSENYGVFSLPEGATFRHHTQEWIKTLLASFRIVEEKRIDVKTMNGHSAKAFQLIAQKK